MSPVRALLAAAVLAAAASACGGDDAASSAAASPSSAGSSTPDAGSTSTATSTSTSTAPTTITTELDPNGPPCPRPGPAPSGDEIGWADVDGDGRGERWVRTGSGASTLFLGLYRYGPGCEPRRVHLDGAPAELGVGGSVTHVAGVRCVRSGSGHLVVHAATSSDGVEFKVTTRVLRLDGTDLTEVSSKTTTEDATDPAFGRFATFACRELTL